MLGGYVERLWQLKNSCLAIAELVSENGMENGRLFGELTGEVAALSAAFLWAAATLMFGRIGRQLSPVVLNLAKGVFALLFLIVTLGIQAFLLSRSGSENSSVLALPESSIVYLLFSGAIGIGMGDTAYFSAINRLGARRALLLETLAPPVSAVLAWIFLAERLSETAILGIGLTLVGVAWVISERVPGTLKATWGAGVWIALVAVFCQATGAVLSRAALANTAVDPLWSTLIRLLAGLAFMSVSLVIRPRQLGDYQEKPVEASSFSGASSSWQTRWQKSAIALKTPKLLISVAVVAFFATYLGIWLQQVALKYAATGVAQSLLATSPLFVLPLARVLGDRVSWRSTCGAAVAMGGVWLLFYFKQP